MSLDMEIVKSIAGTVAKEVVSDLMKGGMSGLGAVSPSVYIKYGKEDRISLTGFKVPSKQPTRMVSLSGNGRVVGGNIVLAGADFPLHDMEFSILIDEKLTAKHTIAKLNQYRLTKPELSPLYLIEYYEDATGFGSWVDTARGTFIYTIGVSETFFQQNYRIDVWNPYDIELPLDCFVKYYLW